MLDPMQSAAPRGSGAKSKAGGPDNDNDSGSLAQLDVFAAIDDAEQGDRLAQQGMTQALHGTDVRITAAVDAEVRRQAAAGREFTADDVLPGLSNRRVVGPVFSRLARDGVIECVGATTSTSPTRHGGLTRVWRGVDREVGR